MKQIIFYKTWLVTHHKSPKQDGLNKLIFLQHRSNNIQIWNVPLVPVAGASLGSSTSMSRLTCNGRVFSGFICSMALLVTLKNILKCKRCIKVDAQGWDYLVFWQTVQSLVSVTQYYIFSFLVHFILTEKMTPKELMRISAT